MTPAGIGSARGAEAGGRQLGAGSGFRSRTPFRKGVGIAVVAGLALCARPGSATVALRVVGSDAASGQTATISVELDNDVAVRALEFRLTATPPLTVLSAVRRTARTLGLVADAAVQADGTVKALILDVTGTGAIALGTGAILELDLVLASDLLPGTSVSLRLSDLAAAASGVDPQPIEIEGVDGQFTVLDPVPTAPVGVTDTPDLLATPTPTPIPVATDTPTVTPARALSGRIRYYSADRPVPGVDVGITGPGTVVTSTDEEGTYAVTDLESGSWVTRPTRLGGRGNGVSALDASHVLQTVVGARTFTPEQALACDVTGNGTVSALDASRILQLVVGSIPTLPASTLCGSDWLFIPDPTAPGAPVAVYPWVGGGVCESGAFAYQPLDATLTGQDFLAVLLGDCTGNWSPPAVGRAGGE